MDSAGVKQTIEIPPSLLISAMGQIEDVSQAVTMDLKQPGNPIFLVGDSDSCDLGGSHFNLVQGLAGGTVPKVDLERAPDVFSAVHGAIRGGVVRSCHDLSEGGLAVAIAEMAFAGGLGADVTLDMPERPEETALFGEANTRFLVEVPAGAEQQFSEAIPSAVQIGSVTDGDRLIIRGPDARLLIDEAIDELKAWWQSPLAWE